MSRDTLRNTILLLVVSAFLVLSCAKSGQQPQTTAAGPVKIGQYGILSKSIDIKDGPYTLTDSEQKRKEMAERMDKLKVMYTGAVNIEKDSKLLEVPASVLQYRGKGFTVAETPPEIEFAVVPYDYRFFAAPPEGNTVGPWSNWAQANYYAPTATFYSCLGDHGGYNAHLHLVSYNTVEKKVTCLPEINKLIGRTKDQFGDGKIHGYLDFYQAQYQSRPNLWFCTYWCKYPEPLEKDWATGYDGGYIMSYDMATGDIVNYGVPMPHASWPYHHVDTKRGILYAVGMFGEFLAWDMNTQRTKWAGYLPDGLAWYNRLLLVDEKTGMVYSNNAYWSQPNIKPIPFRKKSDAYHHLVKYDPYQNRFFELACTMPKNSRTGTYDRMRCSTRNRGPDGLFWGVTYSGDIYSFDPDKEEVKEHGLIWPGYDLYCTTIERSPGGRYLYYPIAVHSRSYRYGSPVIQYDTKTGKRKVLAFLFQHFYDKYGYIPGGSYAFKLDDKGEKLFMMWNGDFTDVNELMAKGGWDPKDTTLYGTPSKLDAFGHCAVFVLNIPASERVE
jgi:hypothetical protein